MKLIGLSTKENSHQHLAGGKYEPCILRFMVPGHNSNAAGIIFISDGWLKAMSTTSIACAFRLCRVAGAVVFNSNQTPNQNLFSLLEVRALRDLG